jgi:hypothetical protein
VLVPPVLLCQYQVSETGGVPVRVSVTPISAHCGEFEVGFPGTEGSAFTLTPGVVLLQDVAVKVNVNDAVPAETPVTIPAFVTVATAALLLAQVPPVMGDKVIVLPTQTDAGALTTGSALTVTGVVVALQEVTALVKIKVAVPAETPLTSPALVTVATAALVLAQVPPVMGDKVVVLPTQTEAGAVTTGKVLTVTEAVVALHPLAVLVKVNVAVPAAIPLTRPAFVTVATAALLLAQVPPVVGDNWLVEFIQIDELPVIATRGNIFTVKLLPLIVPVIAGVELTTRIL